MSASLEQITTLAQLLQQATANAEKLAAELQLAKEEVRRLTEDDLPEMMREVGMASFKLADGSEVKVTDEVDCAITVDRRPAAHAWLTEHGFGGLIKSALTVVYGSDEHDAACAAVAQVSALTGHAAELEEKVHPQTLKAFIKEQMAAGLALPQELFSIRPYSKAKITSPKQVAARRLNS